MSIRDKNHSSKWWETMIGKHGSEEAVRDFMAASSNKSNRNKGGTGGFAYMQKHDPERLREISQKAGKSGKRSKSTDIQT